MKYLFCPLILISALATAQCDDAWQANMDSSLSVIKLSEPYTSGIYTLRDTVAANTYRSVVINTNKWYHAVISYSQEQKLENYATVKGLLKVSNIAIVGPADHIDTIWAAYKAIYKGCPAYQAGALYFNHNKTQGVLYDTEGSEGVKRKKIVFRKI